MASSVRWRHLFRESIKPVFAPLKVSGECEDNVAS